MKILLSILVLSALSGTGSAAQTEAVLIGHFSNQKISTREDPHVLSGYQVNLYQQGDLIFGDIGVGVGSTEVAQARLYDIELNRATHTLHFKAKYSSGWEYSKATSAAGREARVLLQFSGKLTPKMLSGKMIQVDPYAPSTTQTSKAVMRRVKDDYTPGNFDDWNSSRTPDPVW